MHTLLSRSITRGRGALVFAVLCAFVHDLRAAQTSLDSVNNINYAGYILDSETTSGHSNIQVQVVFEINNPTGVTATRTSVLQLQLLDTNGVAAPIYDIGNTTVNGSYTYNITNSTTLSAGLGTTITTTARIRPAAWLNDFMPYVVRCTMLTNNTLVGSLTTSPPVNYYHFTNTVSGDAAYNVLLNLTGVAWSRIAAVNTVPGQNTFQVAANYEMRRWDIGGSAANIPVVFNFTLKDGSNTTIPLAHNSQTFFPSIASSGSPTTPALVSTSATLDIQPMAQLDSVNKQYFLMVTISHTNNPVSGQVLLANSQQTTTNELLHFNGNLAFGPINTTMTGLGGIPPANTPSGGVIPTTLASVSGVVNANPTGTYSGSGLGVTLDSAGNAVVTSGSATLTGNDSLGRISFQRTGTLTSAGGSASFLVTLPTGFGYRLGNINSPVLTSSVSFPSVAITPSLAPTTDLIYTPGTTIYAAEEGKPAWLVSDHITWHVATAILDIPPTGAGAVYVRASRFAYLGSISNLLVNPLVMGDKRSNDKYWLALSGANPGTAIQPDAGSNALLTANFDFGPGEFRTHFPYDLDIQWNSASVMNVTNDLAQAGALLSAAPIAVSYTRDCPDCGGGGAGFATITLLPSNSVLNFSLDGGLAAQGATTVPVNLQWGYISAVSDYAQQALNFTNAGFYLPGLFMRGDQNLLASAQGPTTILYTGFGASDPSIIERPASAGYLAGLADYAGLNLRCVADGNHVAKSTIAGTPGITWSLTGRSKYYIRYAGVTGLHEAVTASFPSALTLWGYSFGFSSYGLSYVDSQNKDSLTDGQITLPAPAGFVQGFNNLRFSCLGAPVSGDVPSGDGFKVMNYWAADFATHSIQFKNNNSCSPTSGYLVLGIEGYASHMDQPLYGQVGFFPNGDQIPPSFGLADVTSRLKTPNVFHFDGPNQTTYSLTLAQDAYYNTYSNSPPSVPGWANLFGKLDVPWFEDMQIHLETSCHTNGAAASNALIYLSGGWPRPGSGNSNQGWLNTSAHTPFETNLFDVNNLGWPGTSVVTIDNYRGSQTDEKYHPRAQRLWLGFVNFDYPLSWDTILRSFSSLHELTNDLLVVTVQHHVEYMDAEHAEVDFGADYEGLPKVSVANFVFNKIDDATGMADAMVKGATRPIFNALSTGINQMGQLVNANAQQLMNNALNQAVDPMIDNLYNSLTNAWYSLPILSTDQKVVAFQNSVSNNALAFIQGIGSSATVTNLTQVYKDLCAAADTNAALVAEVRTYLRNATNAIQSVIGVINQDTNGIDLGSNVVGLACQVAGNRPILQNVLTNIVGDLAADYINAFAGPVVSNAIKKLDPTIAKIDTKLLETENVISNVDSVLQPLGEFSDELTNILHQFGADITNLSIQVSASVTQYFGQFNLTIDDPFKTVTPNQLKLFVRQKVQDAWNASNPCQKIQQALRQRLYDAKVSMDKEVDSVFQQMNGAMRDVIGQYLAKLDDKINGCLGDINDVVGAAKLNGHALFDGDSLTDLRIDGHFQFKVPDDLEFDAYLEIKELTSDGSDGACVPGHARFTEVTLGAEKIPVKWLSPDLTVDVETKFTFDGTHAFPINVGGQLTLNGDLEFEAFTLHDLAAAVAFGKEENYLALKGGVKFNDYDFSGAVFFGRTCSLAPLKLIDPDVAGVLGNPPFTGAYCYAQGWLPISEMILGVPPSCLFDISAGIGAGAFYFKQGPTYGGKIFLGVSGELLCIATIEGDITLIGVKHGSDLSYSGHGHFEAEIGHCPFCLKPHKDVTISYSNKHFHLQ